jgi:hypothetical protein
MISEEGMTDALADGTVVAGESWANAATGKIAMAADEPAKIMRKFRI